jgi:hypothetical protein
MSVLDSASIGKNENPSWLAIQAMVNAAIKDHQYFLLNHSMWQVAAAAVAPPVLATATVTTQVKSTATSQLMVNGIVTSLTATDPLLLAADFALGDPATLAIGSVRRWLICWDATNATTKITARPSNTQVIANFSTTAIALAACRWSTLPPNGTVIVGILSVANVTNVFTPGTTLLGAAGVTATYCDGPDVAVAVSSLLTP